MTRFHISIPYWWVKLFEASCIPMDWASETGGHESFQDVFPGLPPGISLLPSLGIEELCTFANILDHVLDSEQELSGRAIQVEANLGEKLRQSSRRSQSKTAIELPLILSQLKLLNFETQSGKVHPYELLGRMHWKQEKGVGLVEYEPLDQTWELMFGYIDPYADAQRLRQGQSSLRHVIEKAPLMAWYSAWLDLNGWDLLVYLRMQQAIQWQVNCLNLSGVYYASLSSLLAGVPEQGLRRRIQGGTTLEKCYLLIRRILKQLGDHGAVKPLNELESYPFDPVDGQWNGIGVAWQISDLNALEQDAHNFLKRPARLFSERFLKNMPDIFAGVFAEPASAELPSLQKSLQELWGNLEESERSSFLNSYPDPRIFSPIAVFAEWSLRSRLQGQFALPAVIRDSIVSPLLDIKNGLSLGEKFSRFSKILRSQPFYADFLTHDEEASLCHVGTTLGEEAFKKTHSDHKLFKAPEPAPVAPTILGTVFESAVGNMDEPVPIPAKTQVLSKASQMRLEKTAAEELDRLARSNINRYQELVRQFLTSLDEEAKEILAELKQHLNQVDFDQHIRKRLIQYIISRPQDWNPHQGPGHRGPGLSAVRI